MQISNMIDLAFGGEFPNGKVVEVYGESESAKSMLGLSFAKAYGDDGLETLYLDVNGGLTQSNFTDAGIKRVTWARPGSSEEAFEIVRSISQHVDLIIIDTVAGLSSQHESAGKSYRGLVNGALRRVMAIAKDNVCFRNSGTIIILNQAYRGKHGLVTSAEKSLSRYVDIRIETKTIFKRATEHLIGLDITRTTVPVLLQKFRMLIVPGEWYSVGDSMYYLLGSKKLSRTKGQGMVLRSGLSIAGQSEWESKAEAVSFFDIVPVEAWIKLFHDYYGKDAGYL